MAMRQSRKRANLVIAFFCALVLLVFYRNRWSSTQWEQPPTQYLEKEPSANPTGDRDVELVVASQRKDNVTWLNDYLHDWHKSIYVVDDPSSPLTVAENKGREANVFLTYIIDRYDSLPGNIIFHHAERFQWHNDNPDYDALPLLQRLNFDYLRNEGYVNLRCVWVLGCPVEIRPVKDEAPFKEMQPIHAKHIYRGAFEQLFPELAVPDEVGVTCCSQFALRRETIWQRPRSDYVRYRDWLLNSPLEDQLSGRVLEYSWHMIFGKKAVHCPSAPDCYCKLYGLCDLKCSDDKCPGQYTLPPFATLPQGWPKVGWQKEDRHWDGLP